MRGMEGEEEEWGRVECLEPTPSCDAGIRRRAGRVQRPLRAGGRLFRQLLLLFLPTQAMLTPRHITRSRFASCPQALGSPRRASAPMRRWRMRVPGLAWLGRPDSRPGLLALRPKRDLMGDTMGGMRSGRALRLLLRCCGSCAQAEMSLRLVGRRRNFGAYEAGAGVLVR